jgi:hypothetical protein
MSTYNLERAMRAVGSENRALHERGAMESAFRTLETRGASDAEYERLIYRMRHSVHQGPDDPPAGADVVDGLIAALRLRLL